MHHIANPTLAAYRAALARLPIENPKPEDIAALCPHISPKDAFAAFRDGTGVAIPPGLVDGRFHVVFLEAREGRRPTTLERLKTEREHLASKHRAASEALAHARQHWRDALVQDEWPGIFRIFVRDPINLVTLSTGRRYPSSKGILYATLNRTFTEILNDGSLPGSALLDAAIIRILPEGPLADELMGPGEVAGSFYCANCGSGLGPSSCPGCRHRFDDDHCRSVWDAPLPPKAVAFLREQGHAFAIDPAEASERERRKHEIRRDTRR